LEETPDRIREEIERNLMQAEKSMRFIYLQGFLFFQVKQELSKRSLDQALELLTGQNRRALVNRLTAEESAAGGDLRRIVFDNGATRFEIVAPETV
jgi:hypothetical protein